jgi:hypothetical protein
MDDLISRQAAIEEIERWLGYIDDDMVCRMLIGMKRLPSAQQECIIHCKDCKHHWTHKCMDSMPIERCDLGQTFYDAEVDYCSFAKRSEVTI